MKLKLAQVDWVDSTGNQKWEKNADTKSRECCEIRTVGYVIDRNTRHIALAASVDREYGENNDRLLIPCGCIKRIRYLQEK